jgi:hypothetical protein
MENNKMKRKNKVEELDWFEAIQLIGVMNYASEEEEKAMSEELEKFTNTGIDWFHTNDLRKEDEDEPKI